MAYGESNGHVLDDVSCPVFLFVTDYLIRIVTPLSESIKLLGNIKNSKYNRKKLQFIYYLLTAICIVSHIENSKNDKGYITKQHVDILTRCSK